MKVFGFIDNYGGEGDERAPSLIQFSDVSVIGPGKRSSCPATDMSTEPILRWP